MSFQRQVLVAWRSLTWWTEEMLIEEEVLLQWKMKDEGEKKLGIEGEKGDEKEVSSPHVH